MNTLKTIFVIEDETILRDAYEIILTSKGYRVETAENGQSALQLLTHIEPDLILLDLLMPVMGGKDFLIASDMAVHHPKVKVIVYSNLSDPDTINEVMELGVNQHVLKSSMSPNNLVEYIDTLLLRK
jgi:two-component system, response regulator